MRKKRIQKGERIGLKLTKAERSLILGRLVLIPTQVEEAIESTPPTKPVMISLDDLDDLAGHVGAEANHTKDKEVQKSLDQISQKIEDLLDRNTDEARPPGGTIRIVEYLAQSLAGERQSILPMQPKSKKGEDQYAIKLTDRQREALVHATRLRRGLKNRLQQVPEGKQTIGFTMKELGEMASEVDMALYFAPSPYKKRLVTVLGKLEDLLGTLEDDEPVEPTSDRRPNL